jgi:kynurenine formamidase
MKIIDLSCSVRDDMMVFPGDPRPTFQWLKRTDTDPCNLSLMQIGLHSGTHIDSPLHFCPEGQSVDKLPLEYFWGKARLFRVKDKPKGQEVSLAELEGTTFNLNGVSIFIFDTGISSLSGTRDYNYLYPVPGEDLLKWLIKAGVTTFMTDAPTIDYPGEAEESPRHKILFQSGLSLVENLFNLRELPENTDFTVCALPLKLSGREGSPCRAAAWLD